MNALFNSVHILCSHLQEFIQNADDAGARKVHFYIDTRTHSYRKDSLINPALAAYQGPSLLVCNDAQFSPTDWENLRKPQQSMKRDDPLKVGKFGIGFNSIYHITGNNEKHYSAKPVA